MSKESEAAKAAKQAEKEAAKAATVGGIEVADPLVLRPVELPLVVKPANGGQWANEAQVEYAKVLNAYAYKNTDKWNKKKEVLIAQLADLEQHPEKIVVYRGAQYGVSFKNKLISPN